MNENTSALLCDFYALTMGHGFFNRAGGVSGGDDRAVFEMFFRRHPFGSGFSVFAGLGTLLRRLESFRFSADDVAYLRSLGMFNDPFLDWCGNFRFGGDLWAFDEGSVVFPHEPLVRVEGSIIECELIEAMLLNTINFQSLIATKTARVYLAAGKGSIMEFGLRRAQGPDGALSASRAAYIGGAAGTSNTLAGKEFGIPALGTMAHAWVMAFDSEEDAFQAYADIYPDRSVFLIDTYDTLKSGLPNAIKVGKRLAEKGYNFGVRLDSGDIHYLSMEVRRALDAAGLPKATITVSNDLDESIIQTLYDAKAPIDSWGVGTRMVTGGEDAAFTGVYKMAARFDNGGMVPVMKFSDNPEKTTNPAVKQVWRINDSSGMAVADALTIDDGEDTIVKGKTYSFWHPAADYRHFNHTMDNDARPMLVKRMEAGKIIDREKPLSEIRAHTIAELETFDHSYRRLLNPHVYKVSISSRLRDLKLRLIENQLGDL